MPFVDEFADMMDDKVQWEKFSHQDAYGVKNYAPPVSIPAREVRKPHIVTDASGREVVASGIIYLAKAIGIDPRDRITLSNGRRPLILAADSYPDEKGDRVEAVHV
ncbi:MAG TPA: hypothetical protein VNL14_16700 [Candidatus Acidoferrales bacterium]|nr:hypothetical protein [Candidatus Acidoferrales bacterium]